MKKRTFNWRYAVLMLLASASGFCLVTDSDMIVLVINTKMLSVVFMFTFFRLLAKWDEDGRIQWLSKYMKED